MHGEDGLFLACQQQQVAPTPALLPAAAWSSPGLRGLLLSAHFGGGYFLLLFFLKINSKGWYREEGKGVLVKEPGDITEQVRM